MSSKITQTHGVLILDACCIINLYASGYMEEIVSLISEEVTISIYVKDTEALTVYATSKTHNRYAKETIDLGALIEKDLIFVTDLQNDTEKQLFAHLVAHNLDDGEAISLAIAICRNWAIATDENMTRKIRDRDYKQVEIITTPHLIKHWVEEAKPSQHIIRAALNNTEKRGNYLVGKRHSLYAWWQKNK